MAGERLSFTERTIQRSTAQGRPWAGGENPPAPSLPDLKSLRDSLKQRARNDRGGIDVVGGLIYIFLIFAGTLGVFYLWSKFPWLISNSPTNVPATPSTPPAPTGPGLLP